MSEFGALQNCLAVMELANIELKQQNRDLRAALEKAPRPMTSLMTAEELKENWKAVNSWFATYDAWMEDVVTKALAKAGE